MTAKAKHILKFILVSIVILGLLAAYGLSSITPAQQKEDSFNSPNTEPFVVGPTESPSAQGPASAPVQ